MRNTGAMPNAAIKSPAMAGPMIRGSRFCIDCSANAIP